MTDTNDNVSNNSEKTLKQETFYSDMKSLFSVVDKILQASNNGLESRNVVEKCYNEYKGCFRPDTQYIHFDIVSELYESIQYDMFSNSQTSEDNDTWLLENNVTFDLGKVIGEKYIKLMCSSVYLKARKLRDNANKNIDQQCKNLNKKKAEIMRNNLEDSYPEIYYPEAFLLKLYKVFQCVNQNKVHEENLKERINYFNEELGLEESSNKKGNLSGFMGFATNMVKNMGFQLPENLPSEENLGKMVNNFMNNQQTKEMISSVFSGLGDLKDIKDPAKAQEVTNNMLKKLTDPSLAESFTANIKNNFNIDLGATDSKEEELESDIEEDDEFSESEEEVEEQDTVSSSSNDTENNSHEEKCESGVCLNK